MKATVTLGLSDGPWGTVLKRTVLPTWVKDFRRHFVFQCTLNWKCKQRCAEIQEHPLTNKDGQENNDLLIYWISLTQWRRYYFIISAQSNVVFEDKRAIFVNVHKLAFTRFYRNHDLYSMDSLHVILKEDA